MKYKRLPIEKQVPVEKVFEVVALFLRKSIYSTYKHNLSRCAITVYPVITTVTGEKIMPITYLSNILICECSNFSSITGSCVSASKVDPHPRTRARSFPVPKGSTPI